MNSILSNTQTAFKYKTDANLKQTFFVFWLLKFPLLVKLLTGGAKLILKYNLPLKFLIKHTIFKVFCAGENLNDALHTIDELEKYKVKSVLDYVSENESNAEGYKLNAKRIINNINTISKSNPGNYVSIKITGLEDLDLLKAVNDYQNIRNKTYSDRLEILIQTIDEICSAAYESDVIVFFDAEERCMQDVYDYIVEMMMEKYNQTKPIVYNTLQMYLKDRIDYLNKLLVSAKQKDYLPGVKLVRGAYLEKEREHAAEKGLPSPVFDTKEETDNSFNAAVKICIDNSSFVHTCIASHNEESINYSMQLIKEKNIKDAKKKVVYSQLLGMSDNISFNLAHAGYETSKYLPYGEIRKAVPYLIRRAEENKSVNGQINREVLLLGNEIERRKKQHA